MNRCKMKLVIKATLDISDCNHTFVTDCKLLFRKLHKVGIDTVFCGPQVIDVYCKQVFFTMTGSTKILKSLYEMVLYFEI